MCCAFSASLNVCIHRTFVSKSLKGHSYRGRISLFQNYSLYVYLEEREV